MIRLRQQQTKPDNIVDECFNMKQSNKATNEGSQFRLPFAFIEGQNSFMQTGNNLRLAFTQTSLTQYIIFEHKWDDIYCIVKENIDKHSILRNYSPKILHNLGFVPVPASIFCRRYMIKQALYLPAYVRSWLISRSKFHDYQRQTR